MTKLQQQLTTIKTIILAVILSIVPLTSVSLANASPIMGRSVVMSNSAGGATGVTYTLTTDALPTNTAVKSVQIQLCESLSDSCASTPVGFSASSSSLASQPSGLGAGSGWTVNTATAGSLRIVNAANATTPSGAVTVVWDNVSNPTSANTTFYGIITTYSAANWTGALDTGSIALSTSSQIEVSLKVDESLTFCAGTSITDQDCGTIAGNTVNLGIGSTTATAKNTSVMAASTNGSTGYSITVSGTTLTSGLNTIDALATGGTSSTGSKQFGINLAATNTTPAVGAEITGAGTGAAAANYGTNNTFRFATGEEIASVSGPTNANTFTISYIANIDGMTPAGAYSTVLTYIATANF